MNKTFTPLIWFYQNFESLEKSEIFAVDNLLDPIGIFSRAIDDLESKVPEMPENIINQILKRL